jgi:hypothetical protein
MVIQQLICRVFSVAIGSILLSLQARASEKLRMDVDFARFRYDENLVFVEVYYQGSPSKMLLKVEKNDSL